MMCEVSLIGSTFGTRCISEVQHQQGTQ